MIIRYLQVNIMNRSCNTLKHLAKFKEHQDKNGSLKFIGKYFIINIYNMFQHSITFRLHIHPVSSIHQATNTRHYLGCKNLLHQKYLLLLQPSFEQSSCLSADYSCLDVWIVLLQKFSDLGHTPSNTSEETCRHRMCRPCPSYLCVAG